MLIFYIYIFSTTLHPLTNYIIYFLNIFKVYCLSSLESEGFFFFKQTYLKLLEYCYVYNTCLIFLIKSIGTADMLHSIMKNLPI